MSIELIESLIGPFEKAIRKGGLHTGDRMRILAVPEIAHVSPESHKRGVCALCDRFGPRKRPVVL